MATEFGRYVEQCREPMECVLVSKYHISEEDLLCVRAPGTTYECACGEGGQCGRHQAVTVIVHSDNDTLADLDG